MSVCHGGNSDDPVSIPAMTDTVAVKFLCLFVMDNIKKSYFMIDNTIRIVSKFCRTKNISLLTIFDPKISLCVSEVCRNDAIIYHYNIRNCTGLEIT